MGVDTNGPIGSVPIDLPDGLTIDAWNLACDAIEEWDRKGLMNYELAIELFRLFHGHG